MLSLKTQTLLDLAIDSMKDDLMVQVRRAGAMKGPPCEGGMQEFMHYLGIYRALTSSRPDGSRLEEPIPMPEDYCTHMD